jgi:hypothetical protein
MRKLRRIPTSVMVATRRIEVSECEGPTSPILKDTLLYPPHDKTIKAKPGMYCCSVDRAPPWWQVPLSALKESSI